MLINGDKLNVLPVIIEQGAESNKREKNYTILGMDHCTQRRETDVFTPLDIHELHVQYCVKIDEIRLLQALLDEYLPYSLLNNLRPETSRFFVY